MPPIAPVPDPGCEATRRARGLAGLTVAALLVHAAFLGGMEWAWPVSTAALRPGVALHVRALDGPARPAPIAPPAPAAQPDARVASVEAPAPLSGDAAAGTTRAQPARARRPSGAAVPAREPERLPFRAGIEAELPPDSASLRHAGLAAVPPVGEAPVPNPAESAASPEAAPPVEEPIPLYRTRFPPPATLRYTIRRGAQEGSAEMQWRPTTEGYTLRLEGRAGAGAMLAQASEGGFDSAGLAPVRYTDQRARRSALATNFQREAGKISFSGSSREFPLVRGGQDRLSWMIQLAAVLAAEPGRRVPGALVALPVAGVRGDAGVWAFRCVGLEDVSTDIGPLRALKLIRDSHGPYDLDVEVWLDPDRHYLPLQLNLRTASAAQSLDLVLRELVLEP